jgi:ribosome-associated translation inhibitor RaiA
MQVPLEITFRGMPRWEQAEATVRKHAKDLERFFDRITSCRVLIEASRPGHEKGQIYHVRIDLTAPGREIVVKRDPKEHHAHEDLYLAIRDAFRATRRQLQDYVRERRGLVKAHETPPHGRVTKLFRNSGCTEPGSRRLASRPDARPSGKVTADGCLAPYGGGPLARHAMVPRAPSHPCYTTRRSRSWSRASTRPFAGSRS